MEGKAKQLVKKCDALKEALATTVASNKAENASGVIPAVVSKHLHGTEPVSAVRSSAIVGVHVAVGDFGVNALVGTDFAPASVSCVDVSVNTDFPIIDATTIVDSGDMKSGVFSGLGNAATIAPTTGLSSFGATTTVVATYSPLYCDFSPFFSCVCFARFCDICHAKHLRGSCCVNSRIKKKRSNPVGRPASAVLIKKRKQRLHRLNKKCGVSAFLPLAGASDATAVLPPAGAPVVADSLPVASRPVAIPRRRRQETSSATTTASTIKVEPPHC